MARSEGKGHRIPGWLEFVLCVVAGLLVALVIRRYVAEVYIVPSGSMLETIQEGDRLIGEKVSIKTSSVSAGQIVTFTDPDDPSTTLVKRVIATGGQTVDLVDGKVYVDGRALDEPYTLGKPSYPLDQHSTSLQEAISYPYTVPEGYVWVMGDNRTNSLDSRYFGAVSEDSITSHVVCVVWPPSDIGAL